MQQAEKGRGRGGGACAVGSKEGESPVGTARCPVRAGTGQPGPLPSPLLRGLQEAGDGEGWQAACVACSAAMAAWFVQVGVQGQSEGLAMGWDVAALGMFLPASHAVCLALLCCSLGS